MIIVKEVKTDRPGVVLGLISLKALNDPVCFKKGAEIFSYTNHNL
jgi:hypothetical protein